MKREIFSLIVILITALSFAYSIRVGDVLAVEVLGYQELTRECIVDVEGCISFPLVGRLKVAGMTLDELIKHMTDLLSKHIPEPQVYISLVKISPRNVYVSGVVNTVVDIGMLDLTLSKLVALVGADLSRVDLSRVKLIRDGKIQQIDLSGLIFGEVPSQDVLLKENDQIVLPEKTYAEMVKIVGAVKNPGVYPFKRNMTLLDLVSAAGGTTNEGSGRIVLISDKVEVFSEKDVFEKTILLKPGDTVHVEKYTERFAYVVGAVRTPGMYQFSREETLTLKNLLAKAGGLSLEKKFIEKVWIVRQGKIVGEYSVDIVDQNVPIEVGDLVEIKAFEDTEVYVLGYVRNPGSYRISPAERMTLQKLISLAGGLIGNAEEVEKISIKRGEQRLTLGVDQLDFEVKPGDVVHVEEYVPRRAYVLGYVRNPGLYTFDKKETFSLRNLIAKAGGFVDENGVESIKMGNRVFALDEVINQDVPLENGVFVYVERFSGRFVYMAGDNAGRNGRMAFERDEPFTLLTAVKKYGVEDLSSIKKLALLRGGKEILFQPSTLIQNDVVLETGDTVIVRFVGSRRVYFTGDVYGYVEFAKEEQMDLERAMAKFGKVENRYIERLRVFSPNGPIELEAIKPLALNDGDVVEVKLRRSVRVYVDGFVNVPGRVVFEPDERATVELAIVKAGSFVKSEVFEPKDILLFREGSQQEIKLNECGTVALQDGDYVFVRRKEKVHVYVFGEGVNNALVSFEKEQAPTLRNVLGRVGGLKPSASRRLILISPEGTVREVEYEEVVKGADLVLESGTVVLVPIETENFAYVVGEVTRPGAYELIGDVDLVKLIAQAGGLSNWAMKTRIVLKRGNQEFTYDFTDLSIVQQVKVLPGDVVYVPSVETNVAYVLGNVRSPGVVRIDRFSTLFDAVMRAGGFTQSAAMNRIFLFKGGLEGEVQICDLSGIITGKGSSVNPNVSPGDVIYVPSSPAAQLSDVLPIVRDVLSIIVTSKNLFGW